MEGDLDLEPLEPTFVVTTSMSLRGQWVRCAVAVVVLLLVFRCLSVASCHPFVPRDELQELAD